LLVLRMSPSRHLVHVTNYTSWYSGEDMEEKLASYDPSYFVESTELLDWEKIALVVRPSHHPSIYMPD
jgi:hypothetical protein